MNLLFRVIAAGLCLLPAISSGADLTTLDGKTYQNIRVLRVEADTIYIMHSGGAVKIRLRDLPEEVRKQYAGEAAKAVESAKATAQLHTASWQAAVAKYPELGLRDSSSYKAFMIELDAVRKREPSLLNRTDWPMVIANRVAGSSFTGLGTPAGGSSNIFSSATGVSSDGSVVVGCIKSDSQLEAFRWTAISGMVRLGHLPGCSNSFATATSSNGSVIVGESSSASQCQAFRWTAAGGMVGLGYLPGDSNSSARAVSSDGSVVVGESGSASDLTSFVMLLEKYGAVSGKRYASWSGNSSSASQCQAFRWTTASGMMSLGLLARSSRSFATAISGDGSVVVGRRFQLVGRGGETTLAASEAFRWTATNGILGLGYLPLCLHSSAEAVSSDGLVVVGSSRSVCCEAFRWTAAGGMVGLGYLADSRYSATLVVAGLDAGVARHSEALVVSSDGSVVLGESDPSGGEAFVWDSVNGMRNLRSVLTNDYHLNLNGWLETVARGVSRDGMTIVGTGQHNGRGEGWVARLYKPLNSPATKGGGP